MDRSEILRVLVPERIKQIILAWWILRLFQLSEEAYQGMLASVFEKDCILEGPHHLRDWSWKVLRNSCYDLTRRRRYHVKKWAPLQHADYHAQHLQRFERRRYTHVKLSPVTDLVIENSQNILSYSVKIRQLAEHILKGTTASRQFDRALFQRQHQAYSDDARRDLACPFLIHCWAVPIPHKRVGPWISALSLFSLLPEKAVLNYAQECESLEVIVAAKARAAPR